MVGRCGKRQREDGYDDGGKEGEKQAGDSAGRDGNEVWQTNESDQGRGSESHGWRSRCGGQ